MKNKMTAIEKLRRFYSRFSGGDRVLIVINADPDSIASALAVRRLLWRKAGSVTISHINVIKRPDNIAMAGLLNANLVHVEDIDFGAFDRFVILDSQPAHCDDFSKFVPDAVIDHHPDTGVKAPFVDIRPEYGANASIMTEYIRAAKIKPSAKLATGLFYAIKTDTRNFERQTIIEDLRAFQFVFKYTNVHLARKIEQADLRLDFLKYFKEALNRMRMRRNKAFAHLGHVKNPDICVIIADFLMRIQSVQWSVVSGVAHGKIVIIFRNDGLRKDAGKVAKSGFGNIGSAGGHKSMARAEIPVSAAPEHIDVDDPAKLGEWIIEQVEKKEKKPVKVFKKEVVGL